VEDTQMSFWVRLVAFLSQRAEVSEEQIEDTLVEGWEEDALRQICVGGGKLAKELPLVTSWA